MISELIIILAILFLLGLIAAPLYYYWQASKYRGEDNLDLPAEAREDDGKN